MNANVNECDIWDALAAHLKEAYPYLFISANTYNKPPYIMIEKANDRLTLTTAHEFLFYPRCIRHQIDLADPNLFDHITETIQKWLQERNDP